MNPSKYTIKIFQMNSVLRDFLDRTTYITSMTLQITPK